MVDEKVPKMEEATESKDECASSNGKCASASTPCPASTAPFQLPTINSIRPSEAMHVNVVKVLEDSDYKYARKLCDEHTDWDLVFERKSTRVWTRQFAGSPFAMIKARSEFKDVGVDTCYDVLQDAEYRYKWDKHVLDTVQVGYLNPNNDVCYFAIGALPPIRSRDFVLLRSWLDLGSEKFILAHSVWHDRFPPTKSHVRGVVYLTVYFVRSLASGGCQVTYLTLADPRGKLPSWLINRLTKTIAPRLAKKLHKGCLNYENWQRKHGKEGRQKSWLMGPEQILLECPKLDLAQCIPKGGQQSGQEDEVDETGAKPVDEPPEEEE